MLIDVERTNPIWVAPFPRLVVLGGRRKLVKLGSASKPVSRVPMLLGRVFLTQQQK